MKQPKNILLSIIIFVLVGSIIFLFLKINKIENIINWSENSSLIDITPSKKTSDLTSLQSDIKNNINWCKNSIAAIYTVKTIWSITDDENWEEKEIQTIETLEWNAIVISQDGYLITNKHVVSSHEKTSYKAILQWNSYPVDKIRLDNLLDIAILKIKVKEGTIPATIVTMNNTVDIGDIIFAIKNDPDIGEYIVKWGIINSKNQKFEIQNNNNIYVWLIKNSASIEWWFSGWPLINLNWEVIWINTAIDNIEYSASYALPISQEFINQTLSSIKESWQIIRPYLWIDYSDSDFSVKITNIIEWSPASKTELSVWDIIVWINNIPVSYNNFMYNLYTYKVGKQITLNINNGDHKKDVQITIWKE